MKSLNEYVEALKVFEARTTDERTLKKFHKLFSLITALEVKQVFAKDASKILRRLASLNEQLGMKLQKTDKVLDSNITAIIGIAVKFYNLPVKNFYQNQGMAYGTSFGLILGSVIFATTLNAAYLGAGLALGTGVGWWIGKEKDRKAELEGRVLKIE